MVGLLTPYFTNNTATNFFVANRNLGLVITSITLASQSLDSNALLGNVDLAYRFTLWDGLVVPLGLAASLFINGLTLAPKIQQAHVLTLPDVIGARYGPTVEVLCSLATLGSFLMLLAGNLVGFGRMVSYLWDIRHENSIWMACAVAWLYTYAGGLVSVAYTDVLQGLLGWTGCLVAALYFLGSARDAAPPPSIGFPGM